MKTVFADTFYFLGLINRADSAHAECLRFSRQHQGSLLTTDWVLVELADAMTSLSMRTPAATMIRGLRANPRVRIVPAERVQMEGGLKLYESRTDKEWSLTDCISFQIMSDEGIADALTGDHHFEQAGFNALLLP